MSGYADLCRLQTLADIASRWSACIHHMNSFSGVMQSKQRRSSSIYLLSALLTGRPAFRLFIINSQVEVYIPAIGHMTKCNHSKNPSDTMPTECGKWGAPVGGTLPGVVAGSPVAALLVTSAWPRCAVSSVKCMVTVLCNLTGNSQSPIKVSTKIRGCFHYNNRFWIVLKLGYLSPKIFIDSRFEGSLLTKPPLRNVVFRDISLTVGHLCW